LRPKGAILIILMRTVLIVTVFFIAFHPFAFGNEPETLSLSCKDADIVDVLRGIAIQSGVNIVPDSSVSGTVTIQLSNAPFEAGLRTLLETNGFTYENQDGIYRIHRKVTNPDTLQMSFSDGKLTIDARGADVKDVIRQLSTNARLNIVADSALSGTISAHFSGVPIEEALQALFAANNFTLYQESDIYRVGSRVSQQRGSFAIFANKGLVTIDVKNAPPVDVLQELATQMKINLVIVGNLQGNLTMRLEGVSLETALEMIMAASGAAYKKVEGIYVVGDPTVKPGAENPLLERKVIWLKHLEATEFLNAVPADIPRTSVAVAQESNALVVIGTPQTIAKIESLISELDVSTPEIRSRQQWALWVEVDAEGRISVDAKDAPMEMVVRELSIKTGINVAIIDTSATSSPEISRRRATAQAPQSAQPAQPSQPARTTRASLAVGGLSGNVNLRITKATLEEVLDALFTGTGYTSRLSQSGEKQLYIVGTGDLTTGQVNPLTISKKIELNYLDVSKIMELLPMTIDDANITLIPDQNAIALLGTEEMIEFLTSYLEKIDAPTPQVMIEAMLLEISRGKTKDLGLEFGARKERTILDVASGVGLVFDSLKEVPEAFDLSLKALLSENKARILASPRVAVLSGQTAMIDVGVKYLFQTDIYGGYGYSGYGLEPSLPTRQIPTSTTSSAATGQSYRRTSRDTQELYYPGGYYQRGFNTIDTGITLDLTPWVGNAGEITMTIAPTIRDADEVTSEEARIADRSIDTVIRVKDGGMIIIGGLLQEKELTKEDKVPVLGSIPLMGRLFSKDHKVENESELIIVIKPRIIKSAIEEEREAVEKETR